MLFACNSGHKRMKVAIFYLQNAHCVISECTRFTIKSEDFSYLPSNYPISWRLCLYRQDGNQCVVRSVAAVRNLA
jgi:hypothetical protein